MTAALCKKYAYSLQKSHRKSICGWLAVAKVSWLRHLEVLRWLSMGHLLQSPWLNYFQSQGDEVPRVSPA